ncbi:Mic1 domain-containing protein [Hirschfeldia incana]|nr:Mic1 domain-containing protein [Hirschfeldia incana]
MKEKNSTTTASTLGRILATCSKQAKDYGSCVASKVHEIEKDLCLKEFLALKSCMQHTRHLSALINMPSSSQTSVGSGALSHAYIQHPSLRCNVPDSRGLFYDDANRLLICATSTQVFSWETAPFNPDVSPSVDSIPEGPILSVRLSLDKKVIAVQRSDSEIQFFHRETKKTLTHKCRPGSESILGFFWSDSPLCDLAVVKTSGMDLFACDSAMNLRLVETKKVNVNWYIYTHESRLVLLASGLQCKTITGFQLSTAGVVRLPKFEMTLATTESNSKPIISAGDVHLITVYGRIYCLQVDREAMLFHTYRFYRDAVVQQGSLPIYSSKLSVSVVDNLLLVHQIDAKVVIIYDLFVDSRAPVSAPLPLLWRGYQGSDPSFQATNKENESSESSTSNENIVMYEDAWTFLVPDLILDQTNKVLWRVHLDLEAISASSSDRTSLLEFLQRRKLEANKAKQLCLGIARALILERRPATQVTQAIDVLVTAYSYSVKAGIYKELKNEKSTATPPTDGASPDNERRRASGSSIDDEEEEVEMNVPSGSADEQQESQLSSPAISPDELYKFVFASVEETMIEESDYLVAIITEFLRSISAEKLKVDLNIYVMTVRLLSRSKRFAELSLFITNKIIEPSKEVALQLLESGGQSLRVRKLGLDMLRQLSLHHEYISSLVQDGYYLEALRYAQKRKVTSVRSSLFLEAAFASNDMQHLAAILRVLSELIPGFKETSEYYTFHGLLNETSSSVAV